MCVRQEYLEESSLLDMASVYTGRRADNEVFYEGTVPNLFRLIFVEEAHHAIYTQFKGARNSGNPLNLTPSHYDAQDHEYRALRWQAKHASQEGMEETTIKTLLNRLNNANQVRSEKTAKK